MQNHKKRAQGTDGVDHAGIFFAFGQRFFCRATYTSSWSFPPCRGLSSPSSATVAVPSSRCLLHIASYIFYYRSLWMDSFGGIGAHARLMLRRLALLMSSMMRCFFLTHSRVMATTSSATFCARCSLPTALSLSMYLSRLRSTQN
eukprot:6189828-Pleurochrysis_carterae.AAC.1